MPFAVIAIVALDLATFAYEVSLPTATAREALVARLAVIPYDVMHGITFSAGPPAIATLFTYQFLHANATHVAVNVLFLAAFGPEVESLTGSWRFVAFFLFCGVAGGLAQISIDPGSHVPAIGASGAIAGVLGAYILRFPQRRIFGHIPAFVVIGIWAALQFVHGFGSAAADLLPERGGGTAYFAHIGGFLAGVLASAFFRPAPAHDGRERL